MREIDSIYALDDLRNLVSTGFTRFVIPFSFTIFKGVLISRSDNLTTSAIGSDGLDPGAFLLRIAICSLSPAGDLLDVEVNKSVTASALIPSSANGFAGTQSYEYLISGMKSSAPAKKAKSYHKPLSFDSRKPDEHTEKLSPTSPAEVV